MFQHHGARPYLTNRVCYTPTGYSRRGCFLRIVQDEIPLSPRDRQHGTGRLLYRGILGYLPEYFIPIGHGIDDAVRLCCRRDVPFWPFICQFTSKAYDSPYTFPGKDRCLMTISCSVPAYIFPPMLEYSPSLFSLTTQKSISSGFLSLKGLAIPLKSLTGLSVDVLMECPLVLSFYRCHLPESPLSCAYTLLHAFVVLPESTMFLWFQRIYDDKAEKTVFRHKRYFLGRGGSRKIYSRKLSNRFRLDGCLSFLSALASIWRILSLVRPKTSPTSSRV